MFDAHFGEANLIVLFLVLSIVLVLPAQYWLCRYSRALLVRLLPALVFALGAVVCVVLAYCAMDWDALFYTLFAIYCGLLLAASALGWLLWAILRAWKRRRAEKL